VDDLVRVTREPMCVVVERYGRVWPLGRKGRRGRRRRTSVLPGYVWAPVVEGVDEDVRWALPGDPSRPGTFDRLRLRVGYRDPEGVTRDSPT